MMRFRPAAIAGCAALLTAAAMGAQAGEPAYTHQDPRYGLAVSVDPDAEAWRAQITPRAPWKLSADFPIRFGVEGGEPARSALPVDADGATVELPLAAVPSGRVQARISVAVCQGEICERADHDFQLDAP